MSLNEKIPTQKNVKLPSQPVVAPSDDQKLKASLAHRARKKKAVVPGELGTAEHRPHHGLIYDAPLGLKF